MRAAHVRRTYGYKYGYLDPNMSIFPYLYPIFGYFVALEDPAICARAHMRTKPTSLAVVSIYLWLDGLISG